MTLLVAIAKWIDRAVVVSVFVLIVLMLFITTAGVFWRYILNSALSWSEEMGRYLLVWVSFLGAALATYRGVQIGINAVFDLLPERVRLWLDRLVKILIMIFLAALVVSGIEILPSVRVRTAPTLLITMDIPYWIIPISAAIMLFHLFVDVLKGFQGGGETP